MNHWLAFLLCLSSCLALAQTKQPAFSASSRPVVFAPGFVSDGFDNRDMALSPAGDELFFTVQSKRFSVIMTSRKKGRVWTQPEVAPFSGRFNDLEAAFSPDGKTVFFSSARPLSDTGTAAKDFDIWCVQKKGESWWPPHRLPDAVNTAKDEYYPSVAKTGNLYFTRDNGGAKEDIFMAAYANGQYAAPEALPVEVNSDGYDFNAFVDPDEAYLLFSSYGRKDDRGGGDLYFSTRKDGRWQAAKNMGDAVNSTSLDYCPFVSFDGKYFFFTAKRLAAKPHRPARLNKADVNRLLLSPGNGSDDVYVMDFKAVRELLR